MTLETAVEAQLANLPVSLAVVLPGGRRLGAPIAKVTLYLTKNLQLLHLGAGQLGRIASAYVEGELDIDGSARDIIAVAAALVPDLQSERLPAWRRLLHSVLSRLRHTREADARQVQFHYDVSDEFYSLFLDPKRVYSCAYFATPELRWDNGDWIYADKDLPAAQEAKLDLICRKLLLQQGERFLDVGAGWGGLLLWAVERYGVKGTGVTISPSQYSYVKQLIAQRGFQDRASIKLLDYRDLPELEPYDKVASVGMFEHVGRANLSAYFKKLYRLLRPGGLLLNHGITAGKVDAYQVGAGLGDFIERYIFPGGELQHVSTVQREISKAGLEVLDVENLRPHYVKTMWAWSDALEENLEQARGLVSEKVLRAYRLYLAGCTITFANGNTSLYQLLVSKPSGELQGDPYGAQCGYPFTREYMYSPAIHVY